MTQNDTDGGNTGGCMNKFRIWQNDPEVKRMLYPKDMVDYCELVFIPQSDGSMRPFCHMSQPCYVAPRNFVVMQYTRQHDKNGKEIYEKDIVTMPYYRKTVQYTVREVSAYGIILALEVGIRFWLDCPHKNELVVIGNIYENPELLETEK